MSQNITFRISGMHCASCASNIERGLKKTKGVIDVHVNYGSEHASLNYDDSACSLKKIDSIISSLGYTPHFGIESEQLVEQEKAEELKQLKTRLIISAALTTPLILGAMTNVFPWLTNPLIGWVLATPIQFWIGKSFYQSAWSGLKNKVANMDTLVAIGTSVAYFHSVFSYLFAVYLTKVGITPHSYFETSATIITLILLGKFLELKAKSSTNKALKKLIDEQAHTARVISGKTTKEVSLNLVKIGDIVLVKPGEKIPIDGIIIRGDTTIDESMVTGESWSANKSRKDQVIGSTLNLSGSIEIKVTKVGSETMLAQIIELVRTAQGTRAPVQRMADQVAAIFVPTVILLSVVTFIIWLIFGPSPSLIYALVNLTSVLVVACPCALGLATPTSIMVATGRAALLGILIKDATNLELAGQINTIIFDKTGTITMGKPKVIKSKFLPSQFDIASFATSVELRSAHPMADMIVSYLQGKLIPVTNFHDWPGLGITGKVNGHLVVIGTAKLQAQNKITPNQELTKVEKNWLKQGYSVLSISIGGKDLGRLALSDQIRPAVEQTIKNLHSNNISTILVTGDNQQVANNIARAVGITQVEAEVMPAVKEQIVKKYLSKQKIVAMVGDGINDAPALAAANISIAMGNGTDVAIESAGITLLHSDISLIPQIIKLSRYTMSNIKQNLAWAFGYNLILIPIAMGALYPAFGILLNPMMAAGAMAFSSVSVVLNSLRLKSVKL